VRETPEEIMPFVEDANCDRPTRVKCGPLWYAVKWQGEEWDRTNGEHPGMCDNKLQIISVHEHMAPEKTACTFAHEVAHAIMFAGCWRNTAMDSYTEEMVCDVASYTMVQFWQENPDVFDWWIRLIEGAKK
jgi:hypothetical protein